MWKNFLLIWHFVWGNIIGRLLYPPQVFKSKWFSRPGSDGWAWVCRYWFSQKVMGYNRDCKFPCSPMSHVACPENLEFSMDDLDHFTSVGCYFQANAGIIIGKGSQIAPGVGIITENHDLNDPQLRGKKGKVVIGDKCWLGMNSLILPGVILGPHTVVGGGSIVTKSFPEGHVVIAGNPAKIIKRLGGKNQF